MPAVSTRSCRTSTTAANAMRHSSRHHRNSDTTMKNTIRARTAASVTWRPKVGPTVW